MRRGSSSLLLFTSVFAEIAQLVEHNLAKVGVASSSLVFRSQALEWWNGRHEGLKILWPEMAVRVRVSLRAHHVTTRNFPSGRLRDFFVSCREKSQQPPSGSKKEKDFSASYVLICTFARQFGNLPAQPPPGMPPPAATATPRSPLPAAVPTAPPPPTST